MGFIGNILWIFLGGGIFIFIAYCFGAVVFCLTIVGIPFGVQCFKLSLLGLAPFGKKIEPGKNSSGILSLIMNILWLLFFGIEIALLHLFFAVICAVTIIGIPFARQHLKMIELAIMPFGRKII